MNRVYLQTLGVVGLSAVAALVGATVGTPAAAMAASFEPEWCGTQAPTLAEQLKIEGALVQAGHPEGVITINVYWHVINIGSGFVNGDLSQEQIDATILALNNCYSGATGGFNTSFRFVLAGVDRTTNAAWFNVADGTPEELAMKTALRIGERQDLNIYSKNTGGYSWGGFPWNVANLVDDGPVVAYAYVPGGNYDGDIYSHEVGHWLGLYHTFQGGCNGSGDFVADTPAERDPAFGCPLNRDSCKGRNNPGLDPIDNFMDYTNNACANKFTAGQSSRFDAMWATWRQ